ncbi:hypothetical protein [Sphingomonas soli]|uniref:hypothetical protein n=1 Tax=Sphingomonas soli TaxID=266127 RepID=UPI0008317DA2|nr:hypothetical protein [Sphingomonas soli]
MPPSTQTYFSRNQACRLTVVPREIDTQLKYFEDKLAGADKAGQRRGGIQASNATLERRSADGKWTTVWTRLLVNDVAPASALISDDGRYVVTFDNWHSIGWGDDSIVIYDVAGGGERRLSVEKLLGGPYFEALPHSVSSVQWSNDARFEGGQLVIDILVPNGEPFGTHQTVKLIIDPETGRASRRNAAAWRKAHAAAGSVNEATRRYEAKVRADRAAPLLGAKEESDSHDYLREAFWRVDPDWINAYPATNVLRSPSAPDFAASVQWVKDALREEHDVIMFAGIDESALLTLLERELSSLPARSLGTTRVYVAVSSAARARVEAMFAGKGGKLILLDPAKGIPQRPERLPRSDGSLPSIYDFRED